ncbi:UDP-glucose 4-epimerase GalE [Campylobacter pinnipediorum subsp. caledonicus]|uniref:UDP-glucose 4-epimerase GalE n=1 Tax=Campylobacter pinnipediorum TaxID=1965231 RepID=UPI0009959891|nr:UDP-glucose 4-epimerase GalE [Campylobacter pinnipediorum]AQW86251.1 UDP-GlcNAc/Glc 4-epimerase [Campylobacter pinnipediorum subsp. caledonicus]OPA71984.1 UDP-glucose 4-epimerase GalE [Campylobacter pinnipediorum subsp. caledonicus]
MNILITGGAGYIGSHTLKAFLKENKHNITVIDNLSKGSKKAIDTLLSVGKFDFIKASLEDDLSEIFTKGKFDAIIHFAAFIEVFESTKDPLKYYLNNTANVAKILRYCKEFGVDKFVFSSTAAVYGEPDVSEVGERDNTLPINPYGMSKLMSEKIIQDYAVSNKNFRFAILRYFNVAGADEDGLLGQNYPNATHLIKIATQTALKKRDNMAIFGSDYDTKDGTCIRDYIHVNDLADAHLSALEYIQNNSSEIFNVGYGKGFSVKEVINKVKDVSGVDFSVFDNPRRDGDPAILIAKSEKIKALTGWKPKRDNLELIIKTALEWERKI